jgi:hypothetical protein
MKSTVQTQQLTERREPVQHYPKLCMRTIEHLAKMITGDNPLMPYRGGPKLVTFYNGHGSDEIHASGGGFPSRWDFSQQQLVKHNGTSAIVPIIEDAFDPLHFDNLDVALAVAEVNSYLQRDRLEVVLTAEGARVRSTNGATVAFTASPMAKKRSELRRSSRKRG